MSNASKCIHCGYSKFSHGNMFQPVRLRAAWGCPTHRNGVFKSRRNEKVANQIFRNKAGNTIWLGQRFVHDYEFASTNGSIFGTQMISYYKIKKYWKKVEL